MARLGIIPHGDALLAQGPFKTNTAGPNGKEGGPFLPVLDSTPFTLDSNGTRINTTDPGILAAFTSPTLPLPPGITIQKIANPNMVLADDIATQNIVETVVLVVNMAPVGDIALPGFIPAEPDINGGISNIPFEIKNANANSFTAIFWIETVKNKDGSHIPAIAVLTDAHLLDGLGDREGARACWEKVLQLVPRNLDALENLFTDAWERGVTAAARDYARRGLAAAEESKGPMDRWRWFEDRLLWTPSAFGG